jgi:putative glutamine transport system substrate-binding protein
MKYNLKKTFAFSIAVLIVLLAIAGFFILQQNPHPKGTNSTIDTINSRGYLIVGVEGIAPQFSYQETGGEYHGYEIDLAKKLAGEILGNESAVHFITLTAQERGPMLDSDTIDMAIATFTITKQRLNSYDFSNPYYVAAGGFLVKKDSGITSFSDLQGKKIATLQSTPIKEEINKSVNQLGYSNITIIEYTSYPDGVAALDAGSVACLATDKTILIGYLDNTTTILNDSYSSVPYGIGFKKGSILLNQTNSYLLKWRNDGTLDKLAKANDLPETDWASADTFTKELWSN